MFDPFLRSDDCKPGTEVIFIRAENSKVNIRHNDNVRSVYCLGTRDQNPKSMLYVQRIMVQGANCNDFFAFHYRSTTDIGAILKKLRKLIFTMSIPTIHSRRGVMK